MFLHTLLCSIKEDAASFSLFLTILPNIILYVKIPLPKPKADVLNTKRKITQSHYGRTSRKDEGLTSTSRFLKRSQPARNNV